MADVKISALPAATTPLAGTELVPIVQDGTTKKVAASAMGGYPAAQVYYGYDATQFGPGSITPNPPDGSFAVGVDPSAGWYEVYQRIGGAWEDTDPDGNRIQEALVRNAAREETTGLALDALVDFYGAPIEQVTVLTTIFQAAFTAGLAAAWMDVAKGTLSIGINANTADTATLLGLFTPGYPLRGNVAIAGNWDGYVTSAIASAGNWGTGVFVTLRLFDDASVTNASNAMDVPDSTAPQLWYVDGSSTGALFNGGVYGAIDVSNRFLVKNNENTRWVAGPVMEAFVVDDNATTSSVWDAQAQQIVVSVNQNLLDDIDADIATKAPLASPALTGTPTAPTAALGTNTTQIATTAFVLANDATGIYRQSFSRVGTANEKFTITHNLGNLALNVNLWDTNSNVMIPIESAAHNVSAATTSSFDFTFLNEGSATNYTIVVSG